MLKLTAIKKDYKVGDSTVSALKGLDICFRNNEFVSILGPSGCGKTTLLNIIGGLDKYTSGDLEINGRSTKEFKDRDWDTYRNHSIGFIFQGYNLIPHQTVLGNVELALTIAGMSKAERQEKAKAALDKVGLSDKYYTRPNQLSGGQCQRVAIARALVNDPEVLLADEPTGALDTTTSVQIMDLIKDIAKERLVIMVTHNPELAEQYSTRIIRLLDGEVQSDSNPFDSKDEKKEVKAKQKAEVAVIEISEASTGKTNKPKPLRAKMSFWTAFKLSLQNLFTKKRRSIMTCVAGSIGIIGVSLVLSISYGMQSYINNMQNDMLSGNPIQISKTAFDINSLMGSMSTTEKLDLLKENGWVNVYSTTEQLVEQAERMDNLYVQNTISQDYVDYLKEMPTEYLSTTLFDYGIDVSNNIYTDFRDPSNPEGYDVSLSAIRSIYYSILSSIEGFKDYAPLISMVEASFAQAPDTSTQKGKDYVLSQYNLLHNENVTSRVATEANEIMLVLGSDRTVNDLLLAQLGYYTQDEFVAIAQKAAGEEYDKELYKTLDKISYEDLVGKKFTWYTNDDVFTKNDDPMTSATIPFIYEPYATQLSGQGYELEVVGIIEPKENLSFGMLSSGFYYTTELAEYMIEQNKDSELAQVLIDAGLESYSEMKTKVEMGGQEIEIPAYITYNYKYTLPGTTTELDASSVVTSIDTMEMYMNMFMGGGSGSSSGSSFSLQQMGAVSLPNEISLYPIDFDQKDNVLAYLDVWNSDAEIELASGKKLAASDRENITYSDLLSLVISMIKSLVQIITIALIGFTSLALVVSCVMIGIITYVSVVERIKEIGVIRSLGGRKRDVSNLFIAETGILGFISGVIGLAVTYLLSAVLNIIVSSLVPEIGAIAIFPVHYALIMLALSVGLTLISGLMPSRSAAQKDPAVALRTE